jgi:TRAP-type C4-dicarboxylate transport system permease small subunit
VDEAELKVELKVVFGFFRKKVRKPAKVHQQILVAIVAIFCIVIGLNIVGSQYSQAMKVVKRCFDEFD